MIADALKLSSTSATRRLHAERFPDVSSDEPPYGDRLGRVVSHRLSYTVYIDRVARVAEDWPIIGELTAEHGIVTSPLVPGYRERAGETVRGRL